MSNAIGMRIIAFFVVIECISFSLSYSEHTSLSHCRYWMKNMKRKKKHNVEHMCAAIDLREIPFACCFSFSKNRYLLRICLIITFMPGTAQIYSHTWVVHVYTHLKCVIECCCFLFKTCQGNELINCAAVKSTAGLVVSISFSQILE